MNKADNRLDNLREASISQNNANAKPLSEHGFKGASFHRQSGKWVEPRIYAGLWFVQNEPVKE